MIWLTQLSTSIMCSKYQSKGNEWNEQKDKGSPTKTDEFSEKKTQNAFFHLIWLSRSLLALIACLCCSRKLSSSSSPCNIHLLYWFPAAAAAAASSQIVWKLHLTSSDRYCSVLPPLSESISELIAIWTIEVVIWELFSMIDVTWKSSILFRARWSSVFATTVSDSAISSLWR